MNVMWSVDPDESATNGEYIVEVHATLGPFKSYAEAEEVGCQLRDKLPTKFEVAP